MDLLQFFCLALKHQVKQKLCIKYTVLRLDEAFISTLVCLFFRLSLAAFLIENYLLGTNAKADMFDLSEEKGAV